MDGPCHFLHDKCFPGGPVLATVSAWLDHSQYLQMLCSYQPRAAKENVSWSSSTITILLVMCNVLIISYITIYFLYRDYDIIICDRICKNRT